MKITNIIVVCLIFYINTDNIIFATNDVANYAANQYIVQNSVEKVKKLLSDNSYASFSKTYLLIDSETLSKMTYKEQSLYVSNTFIAADYIYRLCGSINSIRYFDYLLNTELIKYLPKSEQASLYCMRASLERNNGSLVVARNYINKQIDIAEKSGDRLSIKIAYGSKARILIDLDSIDEAIEFYKKSMELCKTKKEKQSIAYEMATIDKKNKSKYESDINNFLATANKNNNYYKAAVNRLVDLKANVEIDKLEKDTFKGYSPIFPPSKDKIAEYRKKKKLIIEKYRRIMYEKYDLN